MAACTVHGCPRLSNVYVRHSVVDGAPATDADFVFVNFDWGGHDGAATYPADMATKTLSYGPGPLRSITQQFDRQLLLASLRGDGTLAVEADDPPRTKLAGPLGRYRSYWDTYATATG